MNRIDRATIVLGLTALLAVLAVTAPASAMNDPVTGRWITRDPLEYSTGSSLSTAVVPTDGRTANIPSAVPEPHDKPNDLQSCSEVSGETDSSYFHSLRSNPLRWRDPSGLLCVPFTTTCGYWGPVGTSWPAYPRGLPPCTARPGGTCCGIGARCVSCVRICSCYLFGGSMRSWVESKVGCDYYAGMGVCATPPGSPAYCIIFSAFAAPTPTCN